MVLTDGMKNYIDGEKGLVFEGKKEVAAPALPPEKTSVTFARSKPVTGNRSEGQRIHPRSYGASS